MFDRVHVYVAGPYTQGDPEANTLRALEVASKLLDLGAIPFVPHLSHYWHKHYPRSYEDWMALDFAWLERCDILYRLPGFSPGADREVEFAAERNIPIFLENEHGNGWNELAAYFLDLRRGRL